MSMCRVFSCVVGRGCLLWPMCSLGKTLLAFDLHSVLPGQICLSLQVSLDFLLVYFTPLYLGGHFWGVLVLEGLVGLHRTFQLQLSQHYQSGYILRLLWYWRFVLETKEIILLFMWLHSSPEFWAVLLTMMATPFLLRDPCPQQEK